MSCSRPSWRASTVKTLARHRIAFSTDSAFPRNARRLGVAQPRLILLVPIVAIGLKVMNEPSQLTPTSLREFVVLEHSQSVSPLLAARRSSLRATGSCDEYFPDAHRSHASWILSVSSWSCCLAALVATKLGLLLLISAHFILVAPTRRREENSNLRSVMLYRPPLPAA